MIIDDVSRNVRIGGLNESIAFGIRKQDMPFVMGLLTDKLYSDKPLAVIREYICNAIDANTQNKSTKNIYVTVPSRFTPSFKVRDFGTGLSHDDVKNIYISLGLSTKRDSNEMIGAFGIGCKAGFAYTDSFNITSWHNGFCNTYTAQKNKSGGLDLLPIGSYASNDPSGMEIEIPVNENDLSEFREKLADFCKYVEAKIDFNDPEFTPPKINKVVDFDRFFVEDHSGWSNHFNLKVLMGNVVYPVNIHQLKKEFHRISCLVLRCDLGDVDISPDREKLEYSSKTIEFLNNSLARISSELGDQIQKNIDKANHPFEVNQIIRSMESSFGDLIPKNTKFTFKGVEWNDGTPIRVSTYVRHKSWRSKKIKYNFHPNENFYLNFISKETVIIKCNPDIRLYPQRISDWYENNKGFTPDRIVVTENTDAHKSLMIEHWKQDNVVNDYKSVYAQVKRQPRAPVNQEVYVCQNMDKYMNFNIKDNYVASLEQIPYITTVGRSNQYANGDDSLYVDVAKSLKIEFFGINKNKVKHIDSRWIPLKDYIQRKVKSILSGKNATKYAMLVEVKKNFDEYYFGAFKQFINNHEDDLIKFGERNSIDNYTEILESILHVNNFGSLLDVAEKIGYTIKTDGVDIKEKLENIIKFSKKYELGLKIYYHGQWLAKDIKKNISDYIRLANRECNCA